MITFYYNPNYTGNDSNGTESKPFKLLTEVYNACKLDNSGENEFVCYSLAIKDNYWFGLKPTQGDISTKLTPGENKTLTLKIYNNSGITGSLFGIYETIITTTSNIDAEWKLHNTIFDISDKQLLLQWFYNKINMKRSILHILSLNISLILLAMSGGGECRA